MGQKTLLPEVPIGTIPTTTDGASAPTVYAVVSTDSQQWHDIGDASVVTLFCEVIQAPTGTSPTLDMKLQHAPTTAGPWDDIPSGALTQFTTVAAIESVTVTSFARFVRVVEKFANADNVYSYTIRLSKVE